MESKTELTSESTIEQVKDLLQMLESGDEKNAQLTLDKLSGGRHNNLFSEIGKLTRQLHEAISEFQMDNRIIQIAGHQIPDAKERLNYVIEQTESAANKTMDGVETCIPLADGIKQDCDQLLSEWARMYRRELKPGEFRELAQQIEEFLAKTGKEAGDLHTLLTDVLLAQDYQDLTGQVIRKVITLVHDVEENLVEMIKMFGGVESYEKEKANTEKVTGAEGPIINKEQRDDVVSGQDDVDDLLSSLGF